MYCIVIESLRNVIASLHNAIALFGNVVTNGVDGEISKSRFLFRIIYVYV